MSAEAMNQDVSRRLVVVDTYSGDTRSAQIGCLLACTLFLFFAMYAWMPLRENHAVWFIGVSTLVEKAFLGLLA